MAKIKLLKCCVIPFLALFHDHLGTNFHVFASFKKKPQNQEAKQILKVKHFLSSFHHNSNYTFILSTKVY